MLRYKLDDLPSNAGEAELPAVELGTKQVTDAISGDDGARQHLRRQFRPGHRHQRAGAAEIRREFAAGDLDRPTKRSWQG